jgi:hypothetical protein
MQQGMRLQEQERRHWSILSYVTFQPLVNGDFYLRNPQAWAYAGGKVSYPPLVGPLSIPFGTPNS